MPSLSVIIPFYKDYAYVQQAVDSVLSEKLPDLEVIIVNDNPGDQSDTFLKDCGFPSPVRIVTHERNRGLSAARNTGVEAAEGEYIGYLDADDFVLPGGLVHHLDWAHTTQSDICHAVTMLRETRNSAVARHQVLSRDRRFFMQNRERTSLKDCPELQFIVSSWQSIYRKDFLTRSGIRFDEAQRKFEDRLYVLETVFSDARFSLTETPVRVWRRRSDSITTSAKSAVDVEMMTALIDKCTGLAEDKVRDGKIAPEHLMREVTHSLGRLLGELPVLDAAIENDDLADRIRPVLTRAMARVAPTADVFEDEFASKMINVHAPNKMGLFYKENLAIEVWSEIVNGDWKAVGKLRNRAEKAGQRYVQAHYPAPPEPAAPAVANADAFKDRELILHLGLHKTGTTYLQRQFELHYDDLRQAGILFPRTGFVDHSAIALKAEGTPGHQEIARALVQDDASFFDALQEEVRESGCKTVVLSCENLCFPFMEFEERKRLVERADRFFAAFPNRRAVAVIRRPDRYIESMYREKITAIQSGETRNILEFLNENRRNLLNVEEMLAPWFAFAGQNHTVLDYEKTRGTGSYFAAFCRALGFESEDLSLDNAGNRAIYKTPHWDVVEVVRSMKVSIKNPKRLAEVSRSFINAAEYYQQGRPDRQLLSVDERLSINADYRGYNEAFFSRIGFGFDFDAIAANIEAGRSDWSAPTAIDYRLLESLMSITQMHDVTDHMARVAAQEAAGRRSGMVKRTLMPLYRNLPDPLRRVAKGTFARIAGR